MFKSRQFSLVAYLGKKVSSSLWHCRLGHPTNSIVTLALNKSSIPFHCNSQPHTCTACLQGKFTHLPFPSNKPKSVIPSEVTHSDVWGLAPQMSLKGYRYYVSFIDECTRYTWIFPLMNKAVVFGVFVQFMHLFTFFSIPILKFSRVMRVGSMLVTSFKPFSPPRVLFIKGLVPICQPKMA